MKNPAAKFTPRNNYARRLFSQSFPVRVDNPISYTHGKYRKLMSKEFDETLYHERNKTETVFSVVKRRFDSEIKSYNDAMKTELLYRVSAYNVIECV